jgi:DNA-directed RNA polymerase specialized sigma24 family protein
MGSEVTVARPPKGRSISGEAFQDFLAWLSPDRDRAGERYNEIHSALIRIFAYRGCDRPEELADETLDRVIRKVDVVAPGYEGNPAAYVHGVAKKVFLEFTRTRKKTAPGTMPDLGFLQPRTDLSAADPEVEQRHRCLEHCLGELDSEERTLILRYYCEERSAKIEERQNMAGETQLSRAALRKRTQRIRERLKACLTRRLAEEKP